MYPVNKPNQYNTPKETPPFFLKEGRWFWMSRIMGTFTPAKEREFRENLMKNIQSKSEE
jgi:hypothetical protein